MEKFDFTTKQLVNSFCYTTIDKNRESSKYVKINGRDYEKYGTEQSVTIIGNLYEDHHNNRILVCGIAKQHPCDTKCNKQISYEVAQEHALNNPDIIFNSVPDNINNYIFSAMMNWYIAGMKLEFIKTRQEIMTAGQNLKIYNR